MKKLLAFACLFSLGFVFAQDAPKPAAEGDAAAPQPRPEGGRGQMQQRMIENMKKRLADSSADILERWDKDGDGKLSAEEFKLAEADIDEARKTVQLSRTLDILKKVDTNGDFVISDEEAAKLPEIMRSMRQGGGPGMGPGFRPGMGGGPRGPRGNGEGFRGGPRGPRGEGRGPRPEGGRGPRGPRPEGDKPAPQPAE